MYNIDRMSIKRLDLLTSKSQGYLISLVNVFFFLSSIKLSKFFIVLFNSNDQRDSLWLVTDVLYVLSDSDDEKHPSTAGEAINGMKRRISQFEAVA